MYPLLTKEQIQSIIVKSLNECAEIKGYRLGQAFFNNLPLELSFNICGTEKDMFHIKDEDLAYTMLLNLGEQL